MREIIGILRQNTVCCGSKSDGIHAFVEIPNSEVVYKLYRMNVNPINDAYFDQFKDELVVVLGEIEHEQWVRVELINRIKVKDR